MISISHLSIAALALAAQSFAAPAPTAELAERQDPVFCFPLVEGIPFWIQSPGDSAYSTCFSRLKALTRLGMAGDEVWTIVPGPPENSSIILVQKSEPTVSVLKAEMFAPGCQIVAARAHQLCLRRPDRFQPTVPDRVGPQEFSKEDPNIGNLTPQHQNSVRRHLHQLAFRLHRRRRYLPRPDHAAGEPTESLESVKKLILYTM